MSFLVLDANVAAKWCVKEKDSDIAVALLANQDLLFIAPDIFLSEVANALLRQHRLGQLGKDELDRALDDLTITSPELVASSSLMKDAVDLAVEIDHPVYDCLDLALAARSEMNLVTADREFAEKCRRRLAASSLVDKIQLLDSFAAS